MTDTVDGDNTTATSPRRRALKPDNKTRPVQKTARLNTRISLEQKVLIARAARSTGRTLTEFVVSVAAERAAEIIRGHEVLVLAGEDSRIFADVMLNPRDPNDALKRAARAHAELIPTASRDWSTIP